MIRAVALAAALLAAGGAGAAERLGVIAVGDPPGGPDADLAELAHQLRAACRDRVGGVEEVSTMRARLLGQGSGATLSELDRAYGGALAVYQNGEFESSARTLRAIVEDLESLPESEETYFQWKRSLLRLAHVAASLEQDREVEAALAKLARTEPTLQPDPDQYSPGFRRRFEELKARVRALPRRRLQVSSEGRPGTLYVNGRPMGTTPVTVTLPAGTYQVGGGVGSLHVPSFRVDLEAEDRSVVLDFALAESLRPNAGPGLALPAARRGYGIIRAGAWLGVDRLVVVSRASEGDAQFLLGSIYDVRRGALLREGSVRMVAGSVPSVNLGALASFLLTGQSSREVKPRTDAPREIIAPLPVAALEPPAPAPNPIAAASTIPPPPPSTTLPTGRAPPPTTAPARAKASGPPVAPPAATAPPAYASPAASPPAPAAPKALRPATAARSRASTASTPPASAATAAAPAHAPAPSLSAPIAVPASAATLAVSQPPAAPSGVSADARATLRRAPSPRRAAWSRPWMRPAALGAGVLAAGFTGVAIHQGVAASSAYGDADRMVGADGLVRPGLDPARYYDLRGDGDRARRNALVSTGVAVAFAATAGALGWISWGPSPEPALAFRF